jgi:cytochrome-b5 reductase
MSSAPAAKSQFLSKAYINGVYVPSGLLIFGCFIVKREWVPYALAVAVALSSFKIWNNSMYLNFLLQANAQPPERYHLPGLTRYLGTKSVLKPTVFQDYELKEKTIVTHNVAM